MEEVIVLLVVVAVLVLFHFAGKEFERIAKMKGHSEKRYYWWSFLMGPIGYSMVIALPDRADKVEATRILNDDLPDL